MCIIAIKPKNVAMPTAEILERIFDKNPDGAGVVYNTSKGLKIIKGLMTKSEFLKACEKIPTTATAILHTRISTSGGVSKELCHPYELTNNFKQLRKTNLTIANGFAVAHNGIFSEFGAMIEANDTMQFIATYLTPLKELKENNNGSILDDDIKPIINKLVSGSRLAIMDVAGNWKKYGNNWEEFNGVYYSNGGYKKIEYSTYYSDRYFNWEKYCDDYYGAYYQPKPKAEAISKSEQAKEKNQIKSLFNKGGTKCNF